MLTLVGVECQNREKQYLITKFGNKKGTTTITAKYSISIRYCFIETENRTYKLAYISYWSSYHVTAKVSSIYSNVGMNA